MAKRKKGQSDAEYELEIIREASNSLKAYNQLLAETKEFHDNIEYVKKHILELEKEAKDLADEAAVLLKSAIASERDKGQELEEEAKLKREAIEITKKELLQYQEELNLRRRAIEQINTKNMAMQETLNLAKGFTKILLRQVPYLLEQQKSVKETELTMGVLSEQASGFRTNIYKASISTNQMGISTKDLAKIQGTYGDNVGRTLQLTEEELTSMAALAKGTMMGAEGAGEFAAQMEKFGLSAQDSVDYVQEVSDSSHSMGLNTGKVIKNLQKNMALLNKYNFEGGVKGLSKMAELATKFKFEMQDIASFADTLMTPEGAVEVASKLQVLGGEWAKLGDPFELMYRSRNDIQGLTEDVINATKATAKFDSATGEIMIDPMEMHRLREVANATGMSFDSLANSAKEAAKFDKIQSGMSNIFDQEDKDFLASMAKFNKKSGQFEVTMQVGNETVTESINALQKITPSVVNSQQDLKQTLEDRAKQSLTFNERFDNLLNTFKSSLLPSFEIVAGAFEKIITGIEPVVKAIATFVAESPVLTLAVTGAIAGLSVLGDVAIWFKRGVVLGQGFMTTASGVGGSSPWSPGQSGPQNTGGGSAGGGRFGRFGKFGKGGMSFGKSLTQGLKVGGGLGLGAMGINAGRSMMDEPDSDLGKSLGVLSKAAEWASYGAMLGSVIPGLGTLAGGVIGGIGGTVSGLFDEGIVGNTNSGNNNNNFGGVTQQDFVSRPGENVIPFSSKDTLIGAKKGGPIDKLIDSNTNGGVNGKVSVEFNKPIKIEGKIEVASGNNSKEIDLEDPILMQSLSKMIMEEINKAINGGKLSSNPVNIA